MARKNKITDLRDHLFETLEALKDGDNPMDLARAAAIADIAQVIINSAKVEVDLLKVVSGSSPGTTFFDLDGTRELPASSAPEPRRLTEANAFAQRRGA